METVKISSPWSAPAYPHVRPSFIDNSDYYVNCVTLFLYAAAGIPDFRSPESGLYHNLGKFNLPDPQAIFDYQFFMENPKPFFAIAKDLYKDSYKPTPSHYFIKLLNDKGSKLIDSIELFVYI